MSSQEPILSMSQETSLSFQDEPELVGAASVQKRPSVDARISTPRQTVHGGPLGNSSNRQPLASHGEGSMLALNGSPGTRRNLAGATPYRLDTTAGQKRTVNGHIKTPSTSASPHEGPGHPRLANGSPQRSPQIGQVRSHFCGCASCMLILP